MDLLSLTVAIFLLSTANACISKMNKIKSLKSARMYGRWTEMELNRDIVGTCECGKRNENKTFQWNLYIFVERPGQPVCTGTIITSNLVATSHECVTILGRHPSIFELWNASTDKPYSFAHTSDVLVTTSSNKTEGESFPVEKIIISSNYLVDSFFDRYLYNDILLLKLKADFTTHSTLNPICIPKDSDDLSFLYQAGEYYGNDKLGGTLLPAMHAGIIWTKDMCDSENNENLQMSPTGSNPAETLCVQWNEMNFLLPVFKGGPLMLKSALSSNAFLGGIAADTVEVSKGGPSLTYFTNILVTIKYIEYQAHLHNSKWCKAPELILVKEVVLGRERTEPLPWEQEHIIATIKDRNETLDCVCGIPNTELIGRVVGGVEAVPYEFGWMALMRLYHNGRGKSSSYCGGAIINDRMVLTASHCVVSEKKLKTGKTASAAVKPENIDLYISIHLRSNDEKAIKLTVETVLFHPDFPQALSQNYFDYDIALLVLTEPIQFAPNGEKGIRPICLPKIGETISLVGQKATVAGWGLTDPVNRHSGADSLQKIELPILNLERCKEVAVAKVTDRFICAGYLDKYKDAAAGDSGGPLKIKRGKQWTEIGLVSWGEDVYVPEEKKEKTAALYTDLTNKLILPFVDFHAKSVNANWCKSEM